MLNVVSLCAVQKQVGVSLGLNNFQTSSVQAIEWGHFQDRQQAKDSTSASALRKGSGLQRGVVSRLRGQWHPVGVPMSDILRKEGCSQLHTEGHATVRKAMPHEGQRTSVPVALDVTRPFWQHL